MALVLSIKEGDGFYLGKESYKLFKVLDEGLVLEKVSTKELHTVPRDVFISLDNYTKVIAGRYVNSRVAKVVIEAPLFIKIKRWYNDSI